VKKVTKVKAADTPKKSALKEKRAEKVKAKAEKKPVKGV